MSDSKATVDKKLELIQEISEIADGLTLEYVKGLKKTINDSDADDEQKAKAFGEMDKVLRVAKQYSDRVLLAEGKATENLGVGGMPFNVIITKTYEQRPEDASQQPEVTTDETDEQE